MSRSRKERSDIEQIEWMRNLLAFMLVAAFVSLIPLFVFKDIPSGNKEVVSYIAGQLSGMALMALGFYFVSKVGQDAMDAKRSENTGKLADVAHEALKQSGAGATDAAANAAEQTAEAAHEKAEEFKP